MWFVWKWSQSATHTHTFLSTAKLTDFFFSIFVLMAQVAIIKSVRLDWVCASRFIYKALSSCHRFFCFDLFFHSSSFCTKNKITCACFLRTNWLVVAFCVTLVWTLLSILFKFWCREKFNETYRLLLLLLLRFFSRNSISFSKQFDISMEIDGNKYRTNQIVTDLKFQLKKAHFKSAFLFMQLIELTLRMNDLFYPSNVISR